MRRHTCTYVPPHVMDSLAGRSNDEVRAAARESIHEGKMRREQRSERILGAAKALAAAAPAAVGASSGNREVYNSNHQWQLRVGSPRAEGDPATGDADQDTTYESLGTIRDFFAGVLERQSIDNQGMDIVASVHVGVNFMNAFWDGDELALGDGDGQIFTSFAQSLDVVAHEYAHGVTQFTANLDYYGQSGALNESFSDVFGTVITQAAANQTAATADWLIGNEIMGPTLFGEALRSMRAPGTAYDNPLMGKDPQPDHMAGYYAGSADNQGVHINSGIPNRAFYLVAREIGTPCAGRIWYHGLQNLWPTAQFNDAVEVLVRSAQTLTLAGVAPQGSTQVVRSAFKQVGLPS